MVAESPLTRKMGHGMGLLNGSMEVDMTLKIEAGKYYRTRDGRKVGPMYKRGGEWVCDNMIDEYIPMWNLKTGVANFTTEGPKSDYPQYDLIAEWADEPDTPKLWRDMTPEEKGALLLAHHEGKVIEYTSVPVIEEGWGIATHPSWVQKYAYRIRPEPKRETVGLWIDCRDSVGKTRIGYIDMIDGKPDPGSVKLDEI
jgi:hypothetical protein